MLPSSSVNRLALITSRGGKTFLSRKDSNSEAGVEKDKLWCNYYNRPQHTRDTCWSLHGRPPMSGVVVVAVVVATVVEVAAHVHTYLPGQTLVFRKKFLLLPLHLDLAVLVVRTLSHSDG